MTIILELPDHLQKQAETLAAARGESVEAIALDLLETSLIIHAESLPQPSDRQRAAVPYMRFLAEQRGLEWDTMSDEAREQLIDDLLHE